MKTIRRFGLVRLPWCRSALLTMGVLPIRNHYYDPLFDGRHLKRPLSDDRSLPAVNWNTEAQLALLSRFDYANELAHFPQEKRDDLTFHYRNRFFESGDAEYWYGVVRTFKPRRLVEIGSGSSTQLAAAAIRKNREEDPAYSCSHVCVEPYENAWLEKLDVSVLRRKVEDIEIDYFSTLGENDILFIDSSHMIRPQGDVLFEYLELLPSLAKGVIVHVHDIFSPKDYPARWVLEDVRFWNEQYLLEAYLSHNDAWEIVGAVNYLKHHHYDALKRACPHLTPDREPSSFYLRRR